MVILVKSLRLDKLDCLYMFLNLNLVFSGEIGLTATGTPLLRHSRKKLKTKRHTIFVQYYDSSYGLCRLDVLCSSVVKFESLISERFIF